MNLNVPLIRATLEDAQVPLEDRSRLTTVAFARALSYRLAVPLEKLDNPVTYYEENLAATATDLVCVLNEAMVLDVDAICALVRNFWLFRYAVVFDATNPAVSKALDQIAACAMQPTSQPLPAQVREDISASVESGLLQRLAVAVHKSLEA